MLPRDSDTANQVITLWETLSPKEGGKSWAHGTGAGTCVGNTCSMFAAHFWVVPSRDSSSSSWERNKPFFIGCPGCLSRLSQTETPESLPSDHSLPYHYQQVEKLCSLLSCGFFP